MRILLFKAIFPRFCKFYSIVVYKKFAILQHVCAIYTFKHLSTKNKLFTKIRINQIFAYCRFFILLDLMRHVLFFVGILCQFVLFPDLRICTVTHNWEVANCIFCVLPLLGVIFCMNNEMRVKRGHGNMREEIFKLFRFPLRITKFSFVNHTVL